MNCIIIHGTMGCPNENWFLWLQNEVAKLLDCETYDVLTPHFPYVVNGGECKGYNLWKKILMPYKEAGLINKETIIIAHSLGPVFIYKFLEETQTHVKAVVSVAGNNNSLLGVKKFDDFNSQFFIDWETLKEASNYAKYRYAFCSEDDPYVPLEQSKKFAEVVGAEQFIIKNAGHFNTKAGYDKFPQLLELVEKIIKDK